MIAINVAQPNKTIGLLKSPSFTSVTGSSTTTSMICNPIIAKNNPIPAPIPSFRLFGIELINQALIGVRDMIKNNTPATFIVIVVLEKMNVKGNIIIGILVFSIIAWTAGLANFNGIASSPPPMTYLFEFDLSAAFTAGMSTVIFTLLFIDFFDTAGTLTSVANVAGKVDKQGKVQDINKAMLSDSVGTVAGAMMGTTTVTSYVESGAGVKAGGKTGMTSLVIGLLFLACIFFAPLATSLPKQIDGAALLFVSILFVRNITDIEWDDIGESAPAILAMIAMPLTYSISNGIALAFVSYALIKLFTGKFSSTSPAIWVIAILSVVSFAVA